MAEGTAGAPLARPEQHSELTTLEAEVNGSPSRVFELLVPRLVPVDGHTHFAVYPDHLLAVMQGDWWYRGEFRVLAAPGGSRISYTIVNVAQTKRRMAAWISRKTVKAAPESFAADINHVVEDLRGG